MNNTTNPGVMPITQNSFTPGATSPRTDAIQQQANMNQRQNDLNKISSGGRRKKHRGGDTSNGQVTVPQFQMQYTPTGGPGTNPNDQVALGAQNGMQSNANATYDNQASKMGGRRKCRKGGNPNWTWGCYSGGKTKHRRSRKTYNRKSRRSHKKTNRRRRN